MGVPGRKAGLSNNKLKCSHAETCTYIRTHTNIHAHVCADIHAYAYTHAHAMPIFIHISLPIQIPVQIQILPSISIYKYMHKYIYTYMHSYICICKYTYMHIKSLTSYCMSIPCISSNVEVCWLLLLRSVETFLLRRGIWSLLVFSSEMNSLFFCHWVSDKGFLNNSCKKIHSFIRISLLRFAQWL